MTFKLPPSWDPSRQYAIPQYMKDEGLTNRARVTKWQPRGSYDNPEPFDPSWDKAYAVPQYILKEGYGQGAKVTEWLPRGYYDGATARQTAAIRSAQVAAREPTLPEPFAQYGRKATAILMKHVGKVAPKERKKVLKRVMDKVDPDLYSRASRYASEHEVRGVPSSTALKLGLSRAMSEGMGKELTELGKKPGRPAAKGQVGLGCYGCAAVLGADLTSQVLSTITAVAAPSVQPGQCSADGRYIWVIGQGGGGYWRPLAAGETCTGISSTTVDTRTGPGGGITGTATDKVEMIDVGPFKIPKDATRYNVYWGNRPMPDEWQALITKSLSDKPNVNLAPGRLWYVVHDFVPGVPSTINSRFITGQLHMMAYAQDGGLKSSECRQPILRFKHPVTGATWGIYLVIEMADPKKAWDSTTNPWIARFDIGPEPSQDEPDGCKEGLFAEFNFINAQITNVLKDVLQDLGGAACELISSPNASAAGSAVSTYYGAGPEAGAAGVQKAQGACGQAPPQQVVQQGSSILMPLLLVGGGLAAVMFLTRKKA